MQKITPGLWFDNNCEEAMNFYVSVFPNSKISSIQRYPEGATEGPMAGMGGKVLNGIFEIEGYRFMALDGGPIFKFTPSISFFINCSTEEEVNSFWDKLSEGGKALMPLDSYPFSKRYGWIQDKFGLSWQIILSNPEGEERPKIVPSLLFIGDNCGKAEEAFKYYISVFKNSKEGNIQRYSAGPGPDKEGTIMYADFQLENQWFANMDSAFDHKFKLNEAISFIVDCDTQEEVDYYWEKLSAVPESEQCGWIKDKFGVSWQIIPKRLGELINDPDQVKSRRVIDAMLKMKKIEIDKLEEAYKGE